MAGRIAYYGNIVTDGLVLNLDAARKDSYNRTGTTWNDISENRNDGTLTNGPTFDSEDYGSIVFDGVDDYVSLPQSSTFNLSGLEFSINLWFNPYSWGKTWQAIFTRGDNSWRVHRYSSSSPANIAFGTSGLSTTDTFTSTVFNTNTWYNVTCIYDGVSKKIYVNGVLDNNTTVTGTLLTGAGYAPNVGRNAQQSGRNFHGSIPIAQIYHRALSQTEITQNFNALRGRYGI